MTLELYPHSKAIVDVSTTSTLLGLGTGGAKTRTALAMAHKHGGSILIICPKQQKLDEIWPNELKKMHLTIPIVVMSKEEFKKKSPYAYDILIIDESHTVVGVSPSVKWKKGIQYPKTSQIFEAVKTYVQTYSPRVILCSATPAPQPMSVWAIATILGHTWDYFAFRKTFYNNIVRIGPNVWLPKKDIATQERLAKALEKLGHFGALSDFFVVPEQTQLTIDTILLDEQVNALHELPLIYPEPLALLTKQHQLEQGIYEGMILPTLKLRHIFAICDDKPQVIIFARYIAQIDHYVAELSKRYPQKLVLGLTGQSKGRKDIIKRCQESKIDPGCILVCQSQVSSGWELPGFKTTIFASLDYSCVNYEQAKGRNLRANSLTANTYIHLIGGEIDRAVYDCILRKTDFSEMVYVLAREKV